MMSCFPCFSRKDGHEKFDTNSTREVKAAMNRNDSTKSMNSSATGKNGANKNIQTQTFTFRELASATENFSPDCLIGEGGFGRVYKGYLENTRQVVAVKQLDRNGLQGNKEFAVEVLMLGLLHHSNLVNLIGYCADGEQRLLVYEFMPLGSLEDHLLELKPDKKPLKWYTRMKIAYGAALGLEYLHEKASPPVIFRDLKSSNILLNEDFSPKLSDFGLAKLGPGGDKFNAASCVMGTYGYCAPEYARNGELTLRSDVYSFGVVLLELISGRRVIDTTLPTNEQNLIAWAQPMFKDQKMFPQLVDPLLNGAYPLIGLNQAVGVAAMCLQEEPSVRPFMADVVTALSFLTDGPPLSRAPTIPSRITGTPISEESTQCHPPEPIIIDTIDRNHSNSSSRKSSLHESSSSESSNRFEISQEVGHSSSLVYSKQAYHDFHLSSSMPPSVHNENFTSQCHPPEPIIIDTIDRNHSNSSSRKSSLHESSSSESSSRFEILQEAGHSSSFVYNKQAYHDFRLSSSMLPSVHNENFSSQYLHKFDEHYFPHSGSAQESKHHPQLSESDRSWTSSSSLCHTHKESDLAADIV